jgi:proline iminopeptidase
MLCAQTLIDPTVFSGPLLTDAGWLDVGDGHRVAWSSHGNPDGLPVLVLHGGPGSGASLKQLDLFPLNACRVILMDQRGCGRSTPLGLLTANTTARLVQDVTALRRHLGIRRWLLVGGSWGATLAMACAQADPQACLGVLLRAPFLASEADLQWFCVDAGRMRPQAHAHFTGLPALKACRGAPTVTQLLDAYADAFTQGDVSALNRWLYWEATLEQVLQPPTPEALIPSPERLPVLMARARIQTHYLRHQCFVDSARLRHGLRTLASVPCAIVQGDMDWVCLPGNARAVQQAWPGAVLHTVAHGTHSPFQGQMPWAVSHLVCQFVAHRRFTAVADCSALAQACAARA